MERTPIKPLKYLTSWGVNAEFLVRAVDRGIGE